MSIFVEKLSNISFPEYFNAKVRHAFLKFLFYLVLYTFVKDEITVEALVQVPCHDVVQKFHKRLAAILQTKRHSHNLKLSFFLHSMSLIGKRIFSVPQNL